MESVFLGCFLFGFLMVIVSFSLFLRGLSAPAAGKK